MKSPEPGDVLAESIITKYAYTPMFKIGRRVVDIAGLSGKVVELSERIHEKHQVQTGEQPERISEALMQCKEQMLVRDNYKPEYFLKEPGLTPDEETFGFINQVEKNRLTKFAIDLFFTGASRLFYDYFKTRVSVVGTELSDLSRKRLDA